MFKYINLYSEAEVKNKRMPPTDTQTYTLKLTYILGGARGVMVIVVGNGHGDTSSNPGRD